MGFRKATAAEKTAAREEAARVALARQSEEGPSDEAQESQLSREERAVVEYRRANEKADAEHRKYEVAVAAQRKERGLPEPETEIEPAHGWAAREATLIHMLQGEDTFVFGPERVHWGNLRDAELYGSLRRDAPTELTEALLWCARFRGGTFTLAEARYQPTPRHWYIVRDWHAIVPPNTQRGDEAHARQWRDTVASILGSGPEMFVAVVPGKPIDAILWSAEPRTDAEIRVWSKSLTNPERIEVDVYPWLVPEDGLVYLPAGAIAVATSFRDRRSAEGLPSSAVLLDTGIPALHKQFRTGGLPMGARVVIGGLTGQCKTTLALHFAEAALEQGWFVVWLAYDEAHDRIRARQLQRRGLPASSIAELDALDFFVVRPGEPFEDLARQAHAEAEGMPVMFVVDSIQKLETRAGEGKGERERITASVDAIQACQAKYPSVVVMTAEIARGSGATKGSGAIDYGATLALRVSRRGDRLAVDIPKNRDGAEESFALLVDFERQSLSTPVSATPCGAVELKQALLAAASERPRSRRALEGLVTGKAVAIRKALTELIAAGELIFDGKLCARPECVPRPASPSTP